MRSISIRSASCCSMATTAIACSSRTCSKSSASTCTCSGSASSRARRRPTRAATCRPRTGRKARPTCTRALARLPQVGGGGACRAERGRSQYANGYIDAVTAAGGDAAKVAKDSALITDLKTRQEVEQRLIELVGSDPSGKTYRQVSVSDYLRATHAERQAARQGRGGRRGGRQRRDTRRQAAARYHRRRVDVTAAAPGAARRRHPRGSAARRQPRRQRPGVRADISRSAGAEGRSASRWWCR